MNSKLILSNAEFLVRFASQQATSPKRPFCWVLGSGASEKSGIPLGRDLAKKWLEEMHAGSSAAKKSTPPIKDWANAEFGGKITGFEYDLATNYYPFLYQQRYKQNPEEGFLLLESMVAKAKPSFGYKVLAQIMAHTAHRAAVTTNFDNLLASAINLYTTQLPFVCGHELLADFVIRSLRRPLIAKIHRDLLLAPQNDLDNMAHLPKQWEAPLTALFDQYTPIIVGFGDAGGSGGSLMRFLEKLPPSKSGLFWCYRENEDGAVPAQEIQSIVERHNGKLVPILGFDELMFQLWPVLNLTLARHELDEKYKNLVNDYQEGFHLLADQIKGRAKSSNGETVRSTIKSAEQALKQLGQDS